MSKKVLVLWSGGYDSTYLIFKYLSEGHRVEAANINIQNNNHKSHREDVARRNLTPIFEKQFSERFKDLGSVASVGMATKNTDIKFAQEVFFPLVVNAMSPDCQEIAFGFIVSDYRHEDSAKVHGIFEKVRKMFKAYKAFMPGRSSWQVVFPLLRMKKEETTRLLPAEYRAHVSFCENPNAEPVPCGECGACGMRISHGLMKPVPGGLSPYALALKFPQKLRPNMLSDTGFAGFIS